MGYRPLPLGGESAKYLGPKPRTAKPPIPNLNTLKSPKNLVKPCPSPIKPLQESMITWFGGGLGSYNLPTCRVSWGTKG